MPSNIDVRVSADVTDLTAKFAVARAESNSLNAELNKLARAAAQSGGEISAEMQAGLNAAAEASVRAKARVAELRSELSALGPASRTTATEVSGLSGNLAAVGQGIVALGEFVAAQKVLEFGKDVFQAAANLQRQSDALGVSTDQLQAFAFAARQAGVDTETADAALQKFYVGLGQAAEGTGPALKAYQDLGLSVGQLAADQENASATVARALLGESNQYERNAHIRELFGRSGQDVNAMLANLAQGFDANLSAAKADGEYISGPLAKANLDASIAFDKSYTKLKDDLTPAVTVLATGIDLLVSGFTNLIHWEVSVDAAVVSTAEKILNALNPWKALTGQVEEYNNAAAGAAGQKPPPTPQEKAKTAEQIDVAGLAALDAKLRERKVLTEELAQAENTLKEAKAAGDAQGEASAKIVIGDLNKQLETLNKVKNTTGFSNAGDEAITKAKEQISELNTNVTLSGQQRAQQDAAVWQQVLDHAKLNAKQIEDVHTEMNREIQAGNRAAAQEADQIAHSDVETELSEAKLGLAEKKSMLEEEYAAHRITARQKYDATLQALNDEAAAEIAAQTQVITSDQATVVQKHAAQNEIILINDQTNAAIAASAKQLTEDLKSEDQKRLESWRSVDSEIESVEGTLVSDIFTKRQGLGADLAEIGLKLVQDEIANDLKALTEHQMVNLGMLASDKATAQEGLLYKLIFGAQDTAATVTQEAAKTGAVAAGTAARTGVQAAGAAAGKAISTATAVSEIGRDAAQAGAGAYKAVVGIPIIGPILAPIAAGVAFAAVEAFGSFDKGINVVPHDMVAQIHAGERILPAADNSQLMAALSGGGTRGGDVHVNYAPTINSPQQKPFKQHLEENAGDLVNLIKGMKRDGYLD